MTVSCYNPRGLKVEVFHHHAYFKKTLLSTNTSGSLSQVYVALFRVSVCLYSSVQEFNQEFFSGARQSNVYGWAGTSPHQTSKVARFSVSIERGDFLQWRPL
jgi:hypothetical protein